MSDAEAAEQSHANLLRLEAYASSGALGSSVLQRLLGLGDLENTGMLDASQVVNVHANMICKYAQGWFQGTVQSRTLSARDLKATPSANYVVKYKAADTEKRINGSVACELSERLYGASAWWVVLEQV